MFVRVNIRHLESKSLRLAGEIPVGELGLDGLDELIHVALPLTYELEAAKQGPNIFVHGWIETLLDCECARCLKRFGYRVRVDPYDVLVPLEGEERVEVVADCVDLTPYLREDILLGFPQRPLCELGCQGLPGGKAAGGDRELSGGGAAESSSLWSELNRLKL